jgi:hypothetical protein
LKRLKTIGVLMMLALWMPVTSHELLESAGVIHQTNSDADSDGDHDHDAADGLVLVPSSGNAPVMGAALFCVLPAVVSLLPEPVETRVTERNNSGTSPPLPNVWQFVHRAALPVRAPSSAS